MTALSIYRGATAMAAPLVRLYLRRRAAAGKEDCTRMGEREGLASSSRPAGPLLWLHAASVGESQSALALIDGLLVRRTDLRILVTSGTVTSAELLGKRLPARAIHQFVPVDLQLWVRRFLQHWQPDLAIFMESELWPNLIAETAQTGCPMILVNGRLSDRSFARWQRAPAVAQTLLSRFAMCLGQTKVDRDRFAALGARQVDYVGNLKYSADALPVHDADLQALKEAVGARPVWLAASTHPGEEAIVAAAHRQLREGHPDLLTIIVPRHPARGPEVESLLAAQSLSSSRRSAGQVPGSGDDIYLADTLGELGLFYRLVEVVLIGGTFTDVGGHNPLEAAQLDCAILLGPDMRNFSTVSADLMSTDAAVEVTDAAELAREVGRLLGDADARRRLAAGAKKVTIANADVLARVLDALEPFLAALPAGGQTEP